MHIEVKVVDTLIGQLNKAVQSELHRSIRTADGRGFFYLSAHFETELYNVYHLGDHKISDKNSRCISELLLQLSDLKKLEIHFRVDRYNLSTNKGDVYGYISPSISDTDDDL